MPNLIKFFLMAYLISWVIWLPLYLPFFGITSIPVVPFNHALGAWGPLLAGVFFIRQEQGKSGLVRLLKNSVNPKPIGLLLVALGSPFVLFLLASLLSFWFHNLPIHVSHIGKTIEFPNFNLLSYFIFNLVFFGIGEEVGWKGFALPRLQRDYNALLSSFIFTIFWAIWHWPLFLYRPGYTSMVLPEIIGWFFSLLTGSILLTWLFNSSRGSIFICAVFHAAIDIAFISDYVPGETINYLGMLITIWGIATLIIFGWKNLSKKERVITL